MFFGRLLWIQRQRVLPFHLLLVSSRVDLSNSLVEREEVLPRTSNINNSQVGSLLLPEPEEHRLCCFCQFVVLEYFVGGVGGYLFRYFVPISSVLFHQFYPENLPSRSISLYSSSRRDVFGAVMKGLGRVWSCFDAVKSCLRNKPTQILTKQRSSLIQTSLTPTISSLAPCRQDTCPSFAAGRKRHAKGTAPEDRASAAPLQEDKQINS